ncbi:LRR domain containing protein [Trema orientale]|uniref:LRR domain containing protein n=1 Tax=Trema orientale TaxID=63057 RepID=A0A2P5G2A8_TREOI|nr:LRR domain containing protein [Trema orientale]
MEHLRELHILQSGIREIASSIGNLIGLRSYLYLNDCTNLRSLPRNICNMPSEYFDLSTNCPKLESSPPFSTGLQFLWGLSLSGTSVSEIPDWVFYLPDLYELNLSRTMIRTIPASIKSSKLRTLHVSGCESLQSLPELSLSIVKVDASGCTSLETVVNTSTLLTQEEPWKPWDHEDEYRESFAFDDCLKLDQSNITTEFQSRALRLAIRYSLRLKEMMVQPTYHSYPEVVISLAGDKIPTWFNHQNKEGRVINVNRPTYYHDSTNFMGFASCVVVTRRNIEDAKTYDRPVPAFALNCDVHIIKKPATFCEKLVTFRKYIQDIEAYGKNPVSSHMLMWHFKEVDSRYLSSATEISFDFYPSKKYEIQLDVEVKKCGIHMLTLQDAEEFGIITNEPSGLEEIEKPRRTRTKSLFGIKK